ncbi:MAG: efflux RND transporter periplasmic adaptor subunit [Alphaproteobacteria bacterium]|nr:efflux RND transporter periplasmic adaptor subunit [Alphaproteobacteria bacterium]
MSDDKSELLRSLRIDREVDEAPAQAGPGRGLLIGGAVAALAVGIGIGWIAKPAPKPAPSQAAADAVGAPAAGAPIRAGGLTASGYVVARARATIAAEVTGRVVEVRVEEGQAVKKGQVIAVLDASTARADAVTAEARAASAEAGVRASEAEMVEAERALARLQSLSKGGFASDANLKTAQARLDTATAQLAQARAQVNSARSEASRQRVQLSKYEIRAPFSGIVIDKAAQPGEIISPLSAGGGFTRTGICTIVDMDSLEIEVDVNEAYIGRVKAGQKVEAVLDAYPDAVMPATVIATIPTASRDKATVRVRIAFDAKDPRILPDMAIKVTFLEQAA